MTPVSVQSEKIQPPSPSREQPDYWWYRARSEMLRTIVEPMLGTPDLVLDVGSADGPSVSWMSDHGTRVALDLDFGALKPGDVCGSALALPFKDATFDVITAFDVLEHCEPEHDAMDEFSRVLKPGGRIFLAVPAYQWAWTTFDRDIGHYRRYTRKRLGAAVEKAGLRLERNTHMFAGTLPMFTAERVGRKLRRKPEGVDDTELPQISPTAERILLALCRADERMLRRRNLPFGSSVVAVAAKPR